MEFQLETNRLYLREISELDIDDLYEMDSDPEVHRYLFQNPVKNKKQLLEVIKMIHQQYHENGIGRWAVINKETKECTGWVGLKYCRETLNHRSDYFDLGYRFKQKHWGKGYATEAARAIIDFGFTTLNIDVMVALTDPEHHKSKKVLEKLGFDLIEVFDYNGYPTNWYELSKNNWIKLNDSSSA